MPTEKTGLGKGILRPAAGQERFGVGRFHPSNDLSPFIEHYWTAHWDLRDRPPFVQETLPYPSVHLVCEPGASELVGVMTARFQRVLEGKGRVFAAKFHPGGFYPFYRQSVDKLTDQRVAVDAALGIDPRLLEQELFAQPTEEEMAVRLEEVLRRHLPKPDPHSTSVHALVEAVANDRELTTVAQLSERSGYSVRALQRRFKRYVGIGPKWVIRRFRLHDAAEELAGHVPPNGAELAQRLGYADQAHFVRDFKSIVGVAPSEYSRQCAEKSQLTGPNT